MDYEENELFVWSNTPVSNNEYLSQEKNKSPVKGYTTPVKKQRFSFGGSTPGLSSSPALAKRPPAVDLEKESHTQKAKIPENVLFSELPDEVSNLRQILTTKINLLNCED